MKVDVKLLHIFESRDLGRPHYFSFQISEKGNEQNAATFMINANDHAEDLFDTILRVSRNEPVDELKFLRLVLTCKQAGMYSKIHRKFLKCLADQFYLNNGAAR